MKDLEIVSMVKINGEWVRQEEIPPEEFRQLLEKKLDQVMDGLGFDMVKTA